MSVIVYGMEMPEHCGYCRFRYDGICHALQKTQYSIEECPLVPVPEHGNLIDAGKLVELCDIMANKCDGIGVSIWHQFKTTVEWSPIVIKSEEGET